jgi:hypothetical protein
LTIYLLFYCVVMVAVLLLALLLSIDRLLPKEQLPYRRRNDVMAIVAEDAMESDWKTTVSASAGNTRKSNIVYTYANDYICVTTILTDVSHILFI